MANRWSSLSNRLDAFFQCLVKKRCLDPDFEFYPRCACLEHFKSGTEHKDLLGGVSSLEEARGQVRSVCKLMAWR